MEKIRRILLIEDNPDDEDLLMRQLKKAKLEKHVMAIHDGSTAFDFLTERTFNPENIAAVFLDLRLPGVDGVTLLKAIRSRPSLQDLSVVVMTSSNSPEELETCRKLGVSCYVQKPLTFSSFAKAFADIFHARRSILAASDERALRAA